jgi:hypothetical protein
LAVAAVALLVTSAAPTGPIATQFEGTKVRLPSSTDTIPAEDSSALALEDQIIREVDPWRIDGGSLLSLADQLEDEVGDASEDSLI